MFNIQKAFPQRSGTRRADGAQGEEEDSSGKQMGSTVWGLPGMCCFAVGSSETSYTRIKERGEKRLKPIKIQKSRRNKYIDLNDQW